MTIAQRIVLLVGSIGILHSSMVPPVQQISAAVCRYHEFTLRSWPFTRTYGVANADLVALLSEYGIILALTATVYLILGLLKPKA